MININCLCGCHPALENCYSCCEGKNIITKWISVKEKQPYKDGRYLVVEDNCYKWRGICSLRKGEWDMKVLYWMEIPDLPEELK